jgi:hypothetical protein
MRPDKEKLPGLLEITREGLDHTLLRPYWYIKSREWREAMNNPRSKVITAAFAAGEVLAPILTGIGWWTGDQDILSAGLISGGAVLGVTAMTIGMAYHLRDIMPRRMD